MSIASSARDREALTSPTQERGATVAVITLSERSSIGLAFLRINRIARWLSWLV